MKIANSNDRFSSDCASCSRRSDTAPGTASAARHCCGKPRPRRALTGWPPVSCRRMRSRAVPSPRPRRRT
jgi:hypothetical protein